MIVVKLMGGLGNQLFQYAAARRLAHSSNVPLQLDLSWFDVSCQGTTPRDYALHSFKVQQDFSPAIATPLASPLGKLKVLAHRFFPFPGSYLKEKHYHFDPEILRPRKKAYLDGYWQSEKYFRDIREILLEEFAVRTAPAGLNKSLGEQMQSEDAPGVAVHIRRGDYVNNAMVNDFHGTCSPQYYEAAAKTIVSRFPGARFFVFSDDPAWVAANFAIGRPFTLVTHNGPEAAHEDLRLMTLCRHHIIANSTFSWWGGWLARNADKMVIAPQKWFAGSEPDAKDVIPESWIKL